VKAQAHVVAQKANDGSTRLGRLSSDGPLTLRPTGTGKCARIHLVAGTFGPLGGDDLRLRITVEPGAALEVNAVAATLVLPSRRGEASSMRILIEVAESARLVMAMPPTVVVARARHTVRLSAVLADDSELRLREETVCGRTGEPGGEVTLQTAIDVAGAAVLRQTVRLTAADGAPWNPRALGSLVYVTAGRERPSAGGCAEPGVKAAWMALARDAGHQFSAVADDPLMLRRVLDGAQRQLPR
jgi:urease accessory protein